MTTVITRYFEDAAQARAIRFEMIHRQRLPIQQIHYFESTDGLVNALIGKRVEQTTADGYAKRMANGGAVLMVCAGIKPLAMAKTARQLFGSMGATEIDGLVEEVSYKDPPKRKISVLDDHPFILSRPRDPLSDNYHMADWPIGLISRRKPFRYTVIEPHARMANWPIGLLVPGHKFMAKWPFAHLIPGHKFMANFPFGHIVPGHKFMANFPFGHIVPGHKFMAKFPFAHLIPGHKFMANFPFGHLVPRNRRRMASWPFPLLINGETGRNALVPGAPRMANFPIPLLSKRKPYDEMAIERHGRMANMILPLISKRKPYNEMVIERHGHMADIILPLVIRKDTMATPDADKRFSFSRLLGMPTVIQR